MGDYRKDKIARHEKAVRDKIKKDALKNIEPPEKKEKSPEDVKKFLELWEQNNKNS